MGLFATARKDGSPHTAWNLAAYVEDRLYFYADPSSLCYKNLKRDPRLSLAIISGGSSRAAFIEGKAMKVAKVNELINSELARIRSVVKDWIPDCSYNYISLEECQTIIFEVKMSKILSCKGSTS